MKIPNDLEKKETYFDIFGADVIIVALIADIDNLVHGVQLCFWSDYEGVLGDEGGDQAFTKGDADGRVCVCALYLVHILARNLLS